MTWDRTGGTDPKYRTPEHIAYRKRLVAQLKRDGYLICTAKVCAFPTRRITETNGRRRDGLHAGHEDDGVTYAGPQHAACNVKDGARRARAKQDQPKAPASFTTRRRWAHPPHP
jgi:hypothetical protein